MRRSLDSLRSLGMTTSLKQTPIYRCLHRIASKGVQTIQRIKNALPFREGIVGKGHCGLNS